MQPLLTFQRLSDLLQSRFKCKRTMLARAGEMMDADGTPTPALIVFEREDGAATFEAIVHVYDESAPVMDDYLRHVCARLNIEESDLLPPH